MDVSKVKLSCSLAWLAGVLEHRGAGGHLPESARKLLLSPFAESGQVKEETVSLLTVSALYFDVYKSLFPFESTQLEADDTFWPVIHGLARHGVYLVEEDGESAVNHPTLHQRSPFRESSHIALLDGLMSVFTSSIVTTERVVRAVKKISTFNPSKDLPCSAEESLLLWLNKVSAAVCLKHSQEASTMLQDPDARQRRRNRLKLVGEGEAVIARVSGLSCCLSDGQCLAALLVHYAPHLNKWSDFHFSVHPLPEQKSLHNLLRVDQFCSSRLPPPALHIKPEDLVNFSASGALTTNIMALLAHLFWIFEIKGFSDLGREEEREDSMATRVLLAGNGATASASLLNESGNPGTASSRRSREALNGSISIRKSLIRREPSSKMGVRQLHRTSLASYSTSDLLSEHQTAYFQTPRSNNTKPPRDPLCRLSSFSTSALEDPGHLHKGAKNPGPLASNSAVFHPPVRTSLSSAQATALAGFNHTSKLASSSSSSRLEQIPRPRQQNLITASVENLGIREQMASSRRSNPHTVRPARYNVAGLDDSTDSHSANSSSVELSTSPTALADVSGNGIESWVPNKRAKPTKEDRLRADAAVTRRSSLNQERGVRCEEGVQPAGLATAATAHHSSELGSREKEEGETYNRDEEPCQKEGSSPEDSKQASDPNEPSSRISGSSSSDSSPPTFLMTLLLQVEAGGSIESNHPKFTILSQAMARITSEPTVQEMRLLVERALSQPIPEQHLGISSPPPPQLPLSSSEDSPGTRPSKLTTSKSTTDSPARTDESVPNAKDHLDCTAENHDKNSNEHTSKSPKVPVLQIQPSQVIPAPEPEPPTTSLSSSINPWVHPTFGATVARLEQQPLPGTGHPMGHLPFSPIVIPPGSSNQQTTAGSGGAAESLAQLSNSYWDSHYDPVPVNKEEVLRRKEREVRARLEERERTRKMAVEQRRKEQAMMRSVPEPRRDSHPVVETTGATDILHFQLSSDVHPPPSSHPQAHTTAPSPAGTTSLLLSQPHKPAKVLSHNGPECYIQPRTKSNKKLIKNALCHVCLAGDMNMSMKQRALAELDSSDGCHFIILFRYIVGKFRALYSYVPESHHVTKVFGSGPKKIKTHMIANLYKYNSGGKEFKEIPTNNFSIWVDAMIIKNEFWVQKKTSKRQSGACR